jgi:putative inorganic carbon (HCO3(-)) transporter
MGSNLFIRKRKRANVRIGKYFSRVFLEQKLNNWPGFILFGMLAAGFGYLFAFQMPVGIGLLAAGVGLCIIIACMLSTETGLYVNLFFSFFICHFSRLFFHDYSNVGMASDVLILATLSSFVIKRVDLKRSLREFVRSGAVVWILLLDGYVLVEFYNPGAHSFEGWYIAFRKSLEVLLLMFIAFNVFDSYQKVRRYITMLFVACVIAGLYGCIQQWHGLFDFEKSWIMADDTRYGLFFIAGDFRKFSTMSDPTAYGIVMAACALFFMILSLGPMKRWMKWSLLGGVLIMLLGMSYSGTRTANIMIVAGIVMYLILTIDKVSTWIFAAISTVIFLGLLYVPIYSNSTLMRFRSSFIGRNDESFNTREMSRAIIQPYIRVHPIGGGLGTTGAMGLMYNPGHYLAGFQTDNGYLQYALELGWVGLAIVCIFFYVILRKGVRGYFQCNDEKLKVIYAAAIVCLFSFVIAEFAQTAIGQLSDEVVFYPIIALILKLKYFDKSGSGEQG